MVSVNHPVDQPTYTETEIDGVIKRRVCARCYSHLVKYPAPNRTYEARCPNCGNAWGGKTISKWTAEHRGQRGLSEALEVKQNLKDLFPNPNKGKTAAQLLEDLGF